MSKFYIHTFIAIKHKIGTPKDNQFSVTSQILFRCNPTFVFQTIKMQVFKMSETILPPNNSNSKKNNFKNKL